MIYHAFGILCHQRPDRSYFIAGHKLAVCSRCTGLYAGFAVTLLLYPLIRSLRNNINPPRIYLILAAITLAIDFSLTFFGIWENTHTSRLLTGALLGKRGSVLRDARNSGPEPAVLASLRTPKPADL